MIEGVSIKKNNRTTICTIENFSDDLKEIIRKNLTGICIGKQKADSKPNLYSYEYTLRDFFKRFDSKTDKTKLGMIGELLSHIIIIELNEMLTSVNPYYNMEERSIKKGFDLILFDLDNNYKMWIVEVKAGNLGEASSSTDKNRKLLNVAKNDLIERLNHSYDNVWHNAINGAYVAMKNSDRKDAVINILENSLECSINDSISSCNHNVILTSVLFNNVDDLICFKTIEELCNEIHDSSNFNDIMVVSIHKRTIDKVVGFLRAEVK